MTQLDPFGGVTEYSNLTTVNPVAAIDNITFDGGATIVFLPKDYGKLKEGDLITIVQLDRVSGRHAYEGGTFKLGTPVAEEFSFALLRNDAAITEGTEYVVTGGFAEIIGHEEPAVLLATKKPAAPVAQKAAPVVSKTKEKEEEEDTRGRYKR